MPITTKQSYCCVECGTLTNSFFVPRVNYTQIKKCCHCLLPTDKYFELSDTLKLIELLLITKPILRHFMFNCRINKFTRTLFFIFIIWVESALIIKKEELPHNLIYKILVMKSFLYFLYFAILNWLLREDFLVWNLIFGSYYKIFNFFIIIWDYKNLWVYAWVIDVFNWMVQYRIVELYDCRLGKLFIGLLILYVCLENVGLNVFFNKQ